MDLIDDRTKVGDIVYLRGHTLIPMVVEKIYSPTTFKVVWLDKEGRPCRDIYLTDCLYAASKNLKKF